MESDKKGLAERVFDSIRGSSRFSKGVAILLVAGGIYSAGKVFDRKISVSSVNYGNPHSLSGSSIFERYKMMGAARELYPERVESGDIRIERPRGETEHCM